MNAPSPRVTRRSRIARPAPLALLGTLFGSLLLPGCVETGLVGPTPSTEQPQGPTLAAEIISDPEDDADTLIDSAGIEQVDYLFDILATPIFCCNPLSLNFALELDEALPPGAPLVEWDFGDGKSQVATRPAHTYASPGIYEASAIARWASGITLEASVLLDFVVGPLGGISLVVRPVGERIDASGAGIVADAGRGFLAFEGEPVGLNGSGSRSLSGGSLEYAWSQVSGTSVVLTGADEVIATFEAPAVGGAGALLTFELKVSDGDAVASDRVNITVFDRDGTGEEGPNEDGPGGTGSENHPPSVQDGLREIAHNATVRLTLRGADEDGDDLTFHIVNPPEHGSLVDVVNGADGTASVWYTPAQGFAGDDSFTFRAFDGVENSNLGTFVVRVAGATNGAPLARDGRGAAYVESPTVLLLEGEDPESDALTFEVVQAPSFGSLSAIESTGAQSARVVYTPNPGVVGEDSFAFVASDGVEQSPPAAFRIEIRRLIIPWLEVNLPERLIWEFSPGAEGAGPDTTYKQHCLNGIERYASVTDTMMITTRHASVERFYNWLVPRLPTSVRVIGGIKTFDLLPVLEGQDPYDFADIEGWARIAEVSQEVVDTTGQNIVVFENEGSLRRYFSGEETIDLEKMRIALGPLRDTGIEVWWNLPRILNDAAAFPDRRAQTTELVRAIAETLPDCLFLGGYTAWPDWENDQRIVDRRLAHAEMMGWSRLQDRLLVNLDGFWRWEGTENFRRDFTVEESLLELSNLNTPAVNMYPGGRDWFTVGRRYEELAPYDVFPVRP